MFFGGGGPSTEEIIQEAFKKQRKFIKEQFSKQEKFIDLKITETELESVKARALGVLDALEARYEFIAPYEGLGTCLQENVASEITKRVEYFMDQSDAASVKHTFDTFCPKHLELGEANDAVEVCAFLLYTYLVIEEKRQEILTVMLSLLANDEGFKELSYGYLNVQEHQKEDLQSWIKKSLGNKETYCGLFFYHKPIWKGQTMEETLQYIEHLAPELTKNSLCGVGIGK